jgi:hypothetical protein
MIASNRRLAGGIAASVLLVASGALMWSFAGSVLAASPSLLDRGTGAALYGRCQTDVLRGELLRSAAVLGAFAPDAVNRLVVRSDELTVIALMCAHQVHEHRCTAKIVAVAGDVLAGSHPSGKALPPQKANPGAIVGGTAGAVTGLLLGTQEGLGTAVGAGVIGGTLGAAGGSAVFNKAQMNACIGKQKELDAISMKLGGSTSDISLPGLERLIVSNVRSGAIVQREADILITEANRLQHRAIEVFQAMR